MTAKVFSIAPKFKEGERKMFQELAEIAATAAKEDVSVYEYMQARAGALQQMQEIIETLFPDRKVQEQA